MSSISAFSSNIEAIFAAKYAPASAAPSPLSRWRRGMTG